MDLEKFKNFLFLAKSESKDSNFESLLLSFHIKEVFEKFIELKRTIENTDLVNQENAILTKKEFLRAVIRVLFLHDLGKISYEFQRNIIKKAKIDKYLKNELYNEILNKELNEIKNLNIGRHENYSLVWSFLFLDNQDKYTPLIRTAILYHHYNDFYLLDLKNYFDILFSDLYKIKNYLHFIKKNKEKIDKFLDDLIKEFNIYNDISEELKNLKQNFSKNISNLENITKTLLERENLEEIIYIYNPGIVNTNVKRIDENDYEFILLLGVLRRCDYTGSSGVSIEKEGENVFKELEKSIKTSISEDNFWQKNIIEEIKKRNAINKHIIVSAPTGSGKTELAFLWGSLHKKRKFIYTLPLKAALNDIYTNRILNGYLKNFNEKEDYIGLLHSTSFLENLNRIVNFASELNIELKEQTSRTFSYPFLLTTADQVFLSSLFYYGFDKLFSIYPYSAFVIDEIQSYTPEMMAIIFKTLEHIDKLGGKILIITATYPPYLRKVIEDGLVLNKDNILDFTYYINETYYINKPPEGIEIKNLKLKRHKIQVKDEFLVSIKRIKNKREFKYKISENFISEIKNNNQKNVLVVLNNVMKAIKVYEKIKKELKNHNNIFLLHSRLLEREKQKRIYELKNEIKKGEKGIILISTQILEASVDLDFDILHTEVSPIDSQIQRWGRVYRNRDKNYENNEPNIFIYLGDQSDEDLSIKFSKLIYSSEVLDKTIKVLKEKFVEEKYFENEVLDYKNENELLEYVFDEELVEKYVKNIQENLEFLSYFKAQKRSEAQRIFRKLAGRYIVFLDVMLKQPENKVVKTIAEYINKNLNRLNEVTWNELVEKIKNDLTINEDQNLKYEIKKYLLDYSINIPEYYFNKLNKIKNFKGFYIYYKKLNTNELKDLVEKGFDAIENYIEGDELDLKEIYIL